MMKSPTSPRRIYTRNGITCVCFEGKTYGLAAESTGVQVALPVTVEKVKSNGGRARVRITQDSHDEVWPSVKVPRRPRA